MQHDYDDACKCTRPSTQAIDLALAEPEPVIDNATRAVLARMACDYLNGKFRGPSKLMRLESALTCAYLRGREERDK